MAAADVTRLVVLVLAAGKGERVGGPKALLLVEGKPLAQLHAERAPEGARVVLVVRESVARKLEALGIHTVISDEPDELGPAGSIRAAVRAGVLDDAEKVLVGPVDVPPIAPERLAPLISALDARDAARFERGHPIAIRADVLRHRYRVEAPILRDVLSSLGDRCARVPGASGEADLDTPDDVVRLTGRRPIFMT